MASPDPITTPAEKVSPLDPINLLIVKHRPEIDRIKILNAEGQMEAFRQLGVDPKALEDHYKELAQRSEDLRREDAKAGRKINEAGWASFIAGGLGMYALTRKYKPDSKLVRGFAVGLTAPFAALLGTFGASRLFANKIREQSKQLDIEARNAFERELAVALENREREGKAAPAMAAPQPVQGPATAPDQAVAATPTQEKVVPAAPVTEKIAAEAPAPDQNTAPAVVANVPKRDASFAAQAAADKTTGITIQIRV